ncbi:TSC22 domain family protein 3 isoform X2 [Danio aesculapii]|uniref:TSC22 domain family protein 3 isoform X2 n=1 Tax=Danio aesculapii TaxID=1142201 RepID=UPI0024BF2CAB|nr:TSC22 domain family protein 3 isoform X2 [Danio aesculapii]
MDCPCFALPMDVGVFRSFSISVLSSVLESSSPLSPERSSSGASVVAIDNKIEQAMDLVKSHLMYAVREEVEVLKEQIKELMERNSQLEQENALLKNLSSPEQLQQFQTQTQTQSGSPTAGAPPGLPPAPGAGPTA